MSNQVNSTAIASVEISTNPDTVVAIIEFRNGQAYAYEASTDSEAAALIEEFESVVIRNQENGDVSVGQAFNQLIRPNISGDRL